jgi:hypothetical protein
MNDTKDDGNDPLVDLAASSGLPLTCGPCCEHKQPWMDADMLNKPEIVAALEHFAPVSSALEEEIRRLRFEMLRYRDTTNALKKAHRTEIERADDRWLTITTLRDILGGASQAEIIENASALVSSLAQLTLSPAALRFLEDAVKVSLKNRTDYTDETQAEIERFLMAIDTTERE